MDNKFIIKPKKKYGESSVVSARLPNELIQELDRVASKTGRTRNELIMMCIEFSLENVQIVGANDDE
ncbi:MAG: hypothetical protein BGN88_04885 [Clostridiales bacterium 43-6]|nr:MAG: hypothetical protein BGN88_04885 [Clostridiales bacterium 43-6]